MPEISVVIPVFHNQGSLVALHAGIGEALGALGNPTAEIILVDDGSADRSLEVIRGLAAQDPRVRGLRLSRNFGSTGAILAGLAYAKGDCAAVIAADLQDPPDLIRQMVEEQRKGYDVVLAARASRDDPLPTKVFSWLFYRLFRRFALPTMPVQGFDCFLLTRPVYQRVSLTASANTYLMGHILWLGFRRSVVYYHRRKREIGQSMWSFGRKVGYFIDSFVSFSYAPIRFSSLLGLLLAAAGFLYALVVIAYRLLYAQPVEGWSSLMIVVLILGGTQLLVLGVLGEYLWRALDASRSRPAFVVHEEIRCKTQH